MFEKINKKLFEEGIRGPEELNQKLNTFLTGNADLLKGEVCFDGSGYSTSVLEKVKQRFERVGWHVRIDGTKLWFKVPT